MEKCETIKQAFEIEVYRRIAAGDFVIVEITGRNTPVTERPYMNRYCWVCQLKKGKLYGINGHMYTELVTKAFGD
jgi:uncharacterized protein